MRALDTHVFVTIWLATPFALTGCQSDPAEEVVITGDSDGENGDSDEHTGPYPGGCVDGVPPSPWDTLEWTIKEVDVSDPTHAAGYQGRLLAAADGTVYYAYLKFEYSEATCDIAVFGGGPAPGVNYSLKVAIRNAGGSDWQVETVPLSDVGLPYATSLFGIDATLDSSDRLVISVAAGESGLASCGSGDAVLATRNGAQSWSLQTVATGSGDCCQARTSCEDPGLDCCVDPNCTAGTDVGAWSALGRAESGHLGLAFSDHHNFWDEDGQRHIGLELWEPGGVTGIRPWSGLGRYAALEYRQEVPVVAFTGYNTGGLWVLRRPTTNGDGNDWVEGTFAAADWAHWQLGERIRLESAPDGTLGLLFHMISHPERGTVNNLAYCTSNDDGASWQICRQLGIGKNLRYPALAYDAESRPFVSYYYCGADTECSARNDAVRFAYWDAENSKWWRFVVHDDASNVAGLYNQIVIDPSTGAPIIAFQNVTRGAAVIAEGRFVQGE